MPQNRFVPVFLLGLGNVGRVLLRQILETREIVSRRAGLRLVPIGLADISGIFFSGEGLSDETLREVLQTVSRVHLLNAVAKPRPL
jgi:homoserine dehydrogenase